jgi:hypothetical protein
MKTILTLLLASIGMICLAQENDSGLPHSGKAFTGIAPEGEISTRSISGSYVAFDPSVGGATCYSPFASQDFVFRAESFFTDGGYVTSLWLKFPDGWHINHASLAVEPWCDNGGWGDFYYTIEAPNVIQIHHPRYQDYGSHCIAYYMINVMAGSTFGDANVSWYWNAEVWGPPPFSPCSSNGYTPPGQPPCDEQIHPPATIPFCGTGPSISITPFIQLADACPGNTINFNMNLLNETGAPQTITLNYLVLTDNGSISGPGSLTVDDGESIAFTVSLSADLGISPPNIVNAVVEASGGGFNAAAHPMLQIRYDWWEDIPSEPNNGRMDNVLVSYDNLIWSIMGYGSTHTVRTYNPANDSWTVIPDSEFPNGQNFTRSGASYGSKAYAYGDSHTENFTGLWSYDMANNVWANETPSGTPPAQTGIWAPAWVADPETGYLYITGGATSPGGGNLTTVYVFNPATNAWLTPLPNFTSPRNFHAAYIFTNPVNGHKMLAVAGGVNSANVVLSSTQCYDFVTGTWNAENADIPALPQSWWGMGYANNTKWGKHELWLVGGVDASNEIIPGSAYYDVANGIWVDAGTYHATKVYRTSSIAMNGVVYKIGGSSLGFNYTGQSSKFRTCLDDPFFLPFAEDFTGITTGQIPANWTRNTTYWSVVPTAMAGGTAPEMRLDFFNGPAGTYRLITPWLYGTSPEGYRLRFRHSVDHGSGPYSLKIQSSLDGINWTDEWSIVDPTNITQEIINFDVSHLAGGLFQIAWVLDGNPNNLNYWYIDDISIAEKAPEIEVSPLNLSVELLEGDTDTRYLTLSNTGYLDLHWSASVYPQVGLLAEMRQNLETDNMIRPENSNEPPANPVQAEALPDNTRNDANNVLIFRDQLPWGINVNGPLLQNLGATVSLAASDQMSTIDLSPYGLIVFESEQPSTFYVNYANNLSKFENYLSTGGVIQFHCAAFSGSRIPNLPFPVGMQTLAALALDFNNYTNNPFHPIVNGLSDPLWGNYASHEAFENLPAGADIIVVNGAGLPTTVEYGIGLGRMIVTGMAWEYNYNLGHSSGNLLPRALAYSYGLAFLPQWLSLSPQDGTLLPVTSTPVQVSFNAEYLEVGTYLAEIVFHSNDPATPYLLVPVELVVLGEVPDFTYVSGVEHETGICHNALITVSVSDYAVEPGASVELISAGNIVFYPWVHIKAGSYLWAHISDVFCFQERSLVSEESLIHEEPIYLTAAKESMLFRVYPNPTTGKFTLQLLGNSLTSEVGVEIYGIMGERVFKTWVTGHERFDIDLSLMPRGIYLVKVIAGAETGVLRILKQ